MENSNFVILIPAYNPTKDLIPLVDNLIKESFKVIVVNDGSNNPDSNEIFSALNTKIIKLEHEHNKGKGEALKTGINYIFKNINCLGVITADADGQHLLKDIKNVAMELNNNRKNLILGSRAQNNDMMLKSRIGNGITRKIFKLVTGANVYDTQSGLRGIPTEYLQDFLNIEGSRYEYEINMLLYCAKEKITIQEIRIETVYINNNEASSFKIFKDSYKIYKCILKDSNVLSLMLFTISALLSFIIDFTLLLLLNNILPLGDNKDLHLLLCVIPARIVSSIFNFVFNRNIAFKSKTNIFKAVLKYFLLALIVLVVDYALLDLLTVKLSFNLAISKILVDLFIFICNYIIQKILIFKKGN